HVVLVAVLAAQIRFARALEPAAADQIARLVSGVALLLAPLELVGANLVQVAGDVREQLAVAVVSHAGVDDRKTVELSEHPLALDELELIAREIAAHEHRLEA